jgi:hypothetical protein
LLTHHAKGWHSDNPRLFLNDGEIDLTLWKFGVGSPCQFAFVIVKVNHLTG